MDFLQARIPLLIFGAILAVLVLWRERAKDAPAPGRGDWLTVALGLAALAAGFTVSSATPLGGPIGLGLGVGLIAAAIASLAGGGVAGTSLLAFVAAQSSVASANPAMVVISSAAAAGGVALGGWITGRLESAGPAALFALLAGSMESLGVAQLGGVHAAPAALTAAAIGLACIGVVAAQGQKWIPILAPIGVAAVLFLVGSRVFQYFELGLVGLVSAFVAGLMAWAAPGEEDSETARKPVVVLFGAILMIAVGTAAFAEARGVGMAFAALATLTVAVLCNRPHLAALASPLAALAIYRGFGVAYPDAARALDIGQHYGLIGFLGGLLATLAVADLLGRNQGRAAAFAALAGSAACFAAPLLLGAKGSVGLLTGLGFAPALALLLPGMSKQWGIGALFMGATVCGYAIWRDQMALTRTEKLPILAIVGAFALICGVLAALSNRPTQEHPEGSV